MKKVQIETKYEWNPPFVLCFVLVLCSLYQLLRAISLTCLLSSLFQPRTLSRLSRRHDVGLDNLEPKCTEKPLLS